MILSSSTIIYEVGTVADWLSAIGSIGALFYAIYLARKDSQAKLQVNVGLRTMLNFKFLYNPDTGITEKNYIPGLADTDQDFFEIRFMLDIYNPSSRLRNMNNIGVEIRDNNYMNWSKLKFWKKFPNHFSNINPISYQKIFTKEGFEVKGENIVYFSLQPNELLKMEGSFFFRKEDLSLNTVPPKDYRIFVTWKDERQREHSFYVTDVNL